MKYYRLDVDPEDLDARFISVDHIDANGNWHDVWVFSKGASLQNVSFAFSAADSGEARDFSIASFNIPIVSVKFKEAFEALLKEDVQFVSIAIDGVPAFAMNILSRKTAINLENSILDIGGKNSPSEGKIRGYIKLVVDDSIATPSHCFRLNEFTAPIIVSEEFVRMCKSSSLTGMAFEHCTLDRRSDVAP